MRFSIRDLLGLTAIAAVSLVFGLVVLRANHSEEFAATFAVFAYGTCCYAAGRVLGRPTRAATPNHPLPSAGKLPGFFLRFTIRDVMWLTVVVALSIPAISCLYYRKHSENLSQYLKWHVTAYKRAEASYIREIEAVRGPFEFIARPDPSMPYQFLHEFKYLNPPKNSTSKAPD